jgi:hypothetical protein
LLLGPHHLVLVKAPGDLIAFAPLPGITAE